ncbi:MAG: hypothetical protein AAF366_06300 [Pseudomonadota bacterium]
MIGRLVQFFRPIVPEDYPGGYRIWTRAHDEVIDEASLLHRLASSEIARAARDAFEKDSAAAIAQIQSRALSLADTIRSKAAGDVILLIDLSGSMRHGNHLLAWLLAQGCMTLCGHLGLRHEVLGFTTVAWRGWPARGGWIRRGAPARPGRLCALRHVVLRDLNKTAPGATLDTLFARHLMHENIDGEALVWAVRRARTRRAEDTLILVVSDGAPVDDSTLSANAPDFLGRHLRWVVDWIAQQPDVRVRGIGLNFDVGRYYPDGPVVRSPSDVTDALEMVSSDLVSAGRDFSRS